MTAIRKLSKRENDAGLRIGDEVWVKDESGREGYGPSGMGGKVVRVGRDNIVIATNVRFRPEGPWFHHEHKVPIRHVVAVAIPPLPPGTTRG